MAAKTWKEWEKPLIELESALEQLRAVARAASGDRRAELEAKIAHYEQRRDNYISVKYSRLGPWEKVLVARAEKRPYTLDYVHSIFTDFLELEGDRRAGSDRAIVGGPAVFNGTPIMVVGHQKGRNVQERTLRNFAMAKPEGYRKAVRLFEMADRFGMPIVTFVDTPAADPGVESESRGISEAIAASMLAMFRLSVPVISVIVGEGGSGGAIGIACANVVLMQTNAIYSVIPPEGCAAILWREPEKAPQAAAALRLTAQAAKEFDLVDEVLEEPFGGAHRDPTGAAEIVKKAVEAHLTRLLSWTPEQLRRQRFEKFRRMGRFAETPTPMAVG